MRRRAACLLAGFAAAALACGQVGLRRCGTDAPCPTGATCSSGLCVWNGAPRILAPSSLADATAGVAYAVTPEVAGGTPPFAWSLHDMPAELAWLAVDPSTGALGGTPPDVVYPGKSFTLAVRDAAGEGDSRALRLTVKRCDEGAKLSDCFFISSEACMEGEVKCVGGKPDACRMAGTSTSTQHCGPSCAACGAAADACAQGLCACGAGTACSGGAGTCCGGACVDTRSDVQHCGACGKGCAGTAAMCCGAACVDASSDPQHCGSCENACPGTAPTCCGGKCVDMQSDVQHCGSCSPCPSFTPEELTARHMMRVACVAWKCVPVCLEPGDPNYKYGNPQDCDRDISNGCEVDVAGDNENCGSCGNVCQPGRACNGCGQCTGGAC